MARADYDTPWKEVLDYELQSSLRLLFPRTEKQIDWRVDYEALDGELRKMWPEDELGKRLADKLVKVQNLAGDTRYLHFEIQGNPRDDFPGRMYTYSHLGRGKFKQPVSSLAILADDDPDWRPNEYVEETEESSVVFRFTTAKLLDWLGREAELDAHPEPFAMIVRAHLGARATRQDMAARQDLKWLLVQQLYQRFQDASEARRWYRYLDWLLILPAPDEKEFLVRVNQFEEKQGMPFITSAERIGMEKGIEKGMEKGIEKGREEMVRKVLKKKFGAEGEALLSGREWIWTEETADALITEFLAATTLEEARLVVKGK